MAYITTEDDVFFITTEDGFRISYDRATFDASLSVGFNVSAASQFPTMELDTITTDRIGFGVDASMRKVAVFNAEVGISLVVSQARMIIPTLFFTELAIGFDVQASLRPIVNFNASPTMALGVEAQMEGQVAFNATATIGLDVTARMRLERPEEPTSFRVDRNGATVTLTWIDGALTEQVQVWRSVGHIGTMSLVGTVAKGVQAFSDSVASGQTYAYQLTPIGVTNLKGKSSTTAYSAGNLMV